MESQHENTQTVIKTSKIIFLSADDKDEIEEKKIEPRKLLPKPEKKVIWTEDTIDNENLNRLKSKICCIYHKPKNLENPSSSSTCTSDDSGNGLERSRETKKKHKKQCSKHKGCLHEKK